ncbi:hypothetical protein HDC90_002145 [Pedobacter sp. AK013]|nr:hypothetical protein [Pedobacter sp. AK013]
MFLLTKPSYILGHRHQLASHVVLMKYIWKTMAWVYGRQNIYGNFHTFGNPFTLSDNKLFNPYRLTTFFFL